MQTIVPSDQNQLFSCADCGALVATEPVRPGYSLTCPRCKATLVTDKKESINRTLAFSFTGLMFFLPAAVLPIIELNIYGLTGECSLLRGVSQLYHYGFPLITFLVFLCSILIPVVTLLLLLFMSFSVKFNICTGFLKPALKSYLHLEHWAMLDVYMLGIFIAFVKLRDLGEISTHAGLYCFTALLVSGLAATLVFDPGFVWDRTGNAVDSDLPEFPEKDETVLCRTCNRVCRNYKNGNQCQRCGAGLSVRKPESLSRTWALVITGVFLMIPANLCPITYIINNGVGKPDTIMSGISSLVRDGLIPIAILVFVASVIVPIFKLAGLSLMLFAVHFKWKLNRYQCTIMYRFISIIGRWSMLDLFMLTIVAAMIDMGRVSTVAPGIGATAFALVVVVSMLAAMTYDPRLIWDLEETDNG